jgi:CubicO group peptidase (beta-lactamase class C family)
MKSVFSFVVLLLIVSSCSDNKSETIAKNKTFTAELGALKDYFQIPGLAVSIEKEGKTIYTNYLGVSDIENQVILDDTALFPIASITKVFSGVLIMKLVEQEKLSLDTPINAYFPKPVLGDSILVKHILSHTSQGEVGKAFYYSSRFGLLTSVIEQASGQSYAAFMNQEILAPLKLKNTFLLKDSTQVVDEQRKIAKPYKLDNGVENGFIDFGYSTSAGMVSNLDELAIFNQALDTNVLISKKSKDLMFSSFFSDAPYGFGIFNQTFENLKMVWAYGQYDCYSSLLLKIPSENLTLTLLANNNLLSDPARLIYGDATSSLFVMSFLKNYVLGFHEMELLEKSDSSPLISPYNNTLYRKKLLAQALSASFMARFDPAQMDLSTKLLEKVFSEYPNYLEYADQNLLHTLSFLKDVAFYMELGAFNKFDIHIEQIGKKLLLEAPNNPYVHSYLGTYHARKGNTDKAQYHFESIVNAKNFSQNWYTQEAQSWLNDIQ